MRLSASLPCQWVLTVLLMGLLGVLPGPDARAQDAEPAGAAPLEIDLQRLLFDAEQRGLQDPVWRFEPAVGRRIVMLPMMVNPVDRTTEFSRSPVELRGGRFIGFYIPEARPNNPVDEHQIDLRRFADTGPEVLGRLLFGEEPKDVQGETGEDPYNQQPPADTGAVDLDPPVLGVKPPRLARKIVLEPAGTVKWSMDRGLPSAELQTPSEQNLYPYKLDPALVRDKEPDKPERLERQDGESSRDYAARRREQQEAYRAELDAFRALRDALRDLPDEFEQPVPNLIYAVVEVRDDDEISLQGPSPMPWTLSGPDREMLRMIAQVGGGQLTDEQQRAIGRMTQMVAKGHPMDARAVALAVLRGKLAGALKDNDAGYQLIADLLGSKDDVARRIALYAVVNSEPQSRTTARLIDNAGRLAQGDERAVLQLAALRTLYALGMSEPDQADALMASTNQALAEVNGPPAAGVLDALLTAYNNAAQQGGGEALGRNTAALINGLNLTPVAEAQRGPAIAQIIRHAPANPVAAGWLDLKLLRSQDDATLGQTLALLNHADIAKPVEQASGDENVLAPEQSPTTTPAQADEPADAVTDPPRITLAGPIPINSVNHGLIAALSSANPSHRELAWQSLSRFRVVRAQSTADLPNETDSGAQVLGKVLSTAMGLAQTPASIVAFLDNHTGTQMQSVADAGLLRLIVDRGVAPEVARDAAQQVIASVRDISRALTDNASADQFDVVSGFYRHLEGSVPTVVGLVSDQGGGMADWFARQVAQGTLPSARDWAAQAGGERGGETRLLQLAASEDSRVASAAGAALVVNAGGDESEQRQFAQTVGLMKDRSEESVRAAWTTLKTSLYAKALTAAQGTYTMLIRVTSTAETFDPDTGEPLPPPAPTRIVLGVVELKADGTSVSLSVASVGVGVSEDRLAIRIQSLSSLRGFAKPELADLPLSQLDQPMDLLPQDGGAWAGKTTLPDGREMQVALEPAQ